MITMNVLNNRDLNFIFNVVHVAYHFYCNVIVKFDKTFKIIKYKIFYLYYIIFQYGDE